MPSLVVPSYTYPGIQTIRLVLSSAEGKATKEISEELHIREWRVRAALSGLKTIGLVEASRNGRKIIYKAKGTPKDLVTRYSDTLHAFLVSIFPGRTLDWIAENFWPEEKGTTRHKRANYLVRLGIDLGVVSFLGNTYGLTAEGLELIFPRVLLDVYLAETGGRRGEYVSLTKILDRLETLGIGREMAKKLVIGSVNNIGGRLSSSPAISEEVLEDGIFLGSRGYLYYLSIERGE